MSKSRAFCDSLTRRSLLQVGGGMLFGRSFGLDQLLAAPAERSAGLATETSMILLFLKGGLSTIDTLDMKPQAPAEFRGPFSPVATAVPGIEIGEDLPQLAREMGHFSLVRNFAHRNSDHGPADHYMLTGYHPVAGFNPNLNPNWRAITAP